MTALADLTAGASVRGLLASGAATVESVQWIGQQAVKIILPPRFMSGEMRLRDATCDFVVSTPQMSVRSRGEPK